MALRRSSPTDVSMSAPRLSATLVGRGPLSLSGGRSSGTPTSSALARDPSPWRDPGVEDGTQMDDAHSEGARSVEDTGVATPDCQRAVQHRASAMLGRSQVVLQQLPPEVRSFLGSGLQ
eukprot:246153-Pyramimonas_sp.AAC.1